MAHSIDNLPSVTEDLEAISGLLQGLKPSTDKFESLEDVALLTLEAYANFHISVLWDLRDCLLLGGGFLEVQAIAQKWIAHRTRMLCDNPNSNFQFSKMVPKTKRGIDDYLYQLAWRKMTPGNFSLQKEDRKYLLKLFMQMQRDIQSQIILPIFQIHDVMKVAPSNWTSADTLDMFVRLRAKLTLIVSPELKIFA